MYRSVGQSALVGQSIVSWVIWNRHSCGKRILLSGPLLPYSGHRRAAGTDQVLTRRSQVMPRWWWPQIFTLRWLFRNLWVTSHLLLFFFFCFTVYDLPKLRKPVYTYYFGCKKYTKGSPATKAYCGGCVNSCVCPLSNGSHLSETNQFWWPDSVCHHLMKLNMVSSSSLLQVNAKRKQIMWEVEKGRGRGVDRGTCANK